MKEVVLDPIPERPEDYDEMMDEIIRLFRREIYLPLISEFKQEKLQNSIEDLNQAIASGRVRYFRGRFSGKFNATISKELKKLGAKWEKGSFRLSKFPMSLRSAIAIAETKMNEKQKKILGKLQSLTPEDIADKFKGEKFFDTALYRVNKKIHEQVKRITVAPQLTDAQRKRIAEEYTENMKKYIKDFTEKEITELRGKIEKSTFSGNRYESMLKTIQDSYGVSARKAKFLARQETSLLMAKFKESRYTDMGSEEYIWENAAGSPNHPVRPDHKRLRGTRQKWSSPPVTNLKTGAKNHPGEDFNCRCRARPIIRF